MWRRGGILWLDLGGGFGFAYGHPGDVPLAGHYELPPMDDFARRCGYFENALIDLLASYQPSMVGVEAYMAAKRQKSEAAALSALSLYTLTATACWRASIRCLPRAAATVRTQVIGRCHMTDEERAAGLDVKDAIVRPWVEAQGWNIPNHNARDAAVGWAYDTGIRARKTK